MTLSTPTLNYDSYVQQTADLMVISTGSSNFNTMLPSMIDYAEQRIYREADFLRQQITDNTQALSTGSRTVSLSTTYGSFITVDQVNVLSLPPASLTLVTSFGSIITTSSGAIIIVGSSFLPPGLLVPFENRVPLTPVSRSFLDLVYPSDFTSGVPQFYAMISNTAMIIGPSPDRPYDIEFIGVQRPTPLSCNNSSTYLTQYCPDLFLAASMIYAFGYMRDFGGQADNPQAAQSWENQYQQLFKSARAEADRAKHQSQTWSPYSVSQSASPQRT